MAAHHGNYSCIITNKQLQELPILSNLAPNISNSILTKIQLQYVWLVLTITAAWLHTLLFDRYLSTADQLAAWFNGVHLQSQPHPSVVIVDSYDQYFTSKVGLSQHSVKLHHIDNRILD